MDIERVGSVEVWSVERPRGPRLSPRAALIAGVIVLPSFISALWWVHSRGERVWPWGTVTLLAPSVPQYLLRYLYLLTAGFFYVVAVSAPAWRRLARTAREDLDDARRLVELGEWPAAALHLHRHVLLRGALDDDVVRLDQLISPHLQPGRRLYLYYWGTPPTLPDSPEAGFQPRVVPVSTAGGWWTAGIVALVAVAMFGHLAGVLASGDWRSLARLNFIVEAGVVLAYGAVVMGGLLGRRAYFRFSPGVAELLRFKLRASATETQAISLRRCDVFLDLTGPGAVLSLADRASGRRMAEYELGRGREITETCLRAVLSTAPEHPLPPHELTA